MKTLISILFVMMIIGCATTPTMESVAGTYEMEDGEETIKYVLLENGKGRSYLDGEKWGDWTWKIIEKEIHGFFEEEYEGTVFKIETTGDLTAIAEILAGERTDFSKEEQTTYKKIK